MVALNHDYRFSCTVEQSHPRTLPRMSGSAYPRFSGARVGLRFYDKNVGRWTTMDPIGIAGGLNQYVFCIDNPVNFRDAYGTSFIGEFVGVATMGIGIAVALYMAPEIGLGIGIAVVGAAITVWSSDVFHVVHKATDQCKKKVQERNKTIGQAIKDIDGDTSTNNVQPEPVTMRDILKGINEGR